ncbi:MAG: prephenate dehydrogenase/arogenate dehydrogenase family protein [Pseudomonadota bacterium]
MATEDGFSGFKACVVGGRGRMGAWFARRLAASGWSVTIADSADGPLKPAAVAGCQLVLMAVPLPALGRALASVAPFIPAEALLADLCSLKAAPLEMMLKAFPGQVLGLHPLFGPAAPSLANQTVFACPGRPGPLAERLTIWLEGAGAVVTEIDPGRHDRLMALTQSLRHLLLAGLGRALAAQGFDPADLALAGPWFNQLWDLLSRQCRQPGGLYADLALANPAARPAAEALAGACADLAGRVAAGDWAGLAGGLDDLADWVGGAEKGLDGAAA